MKAALRGSYVEFVCFMGVTENYPDWFAEILYDCTYTDDNRYTFYVPPEERNVDYYEKHLIEDYSVFLRKPSGEVHVTDYEVLQYMYTTFRYSSFTNSGLAALDEDTIEYVECSERNVLLKEYPGWFYEYATEAIQLPDDEGICLIISDEGEVIISNRCVFLRNRFGEIRSMHYDDFIKYYDPDPKLGRN